MKKLIKNITRTALVLTAAMAAGLILTAGIFTDEVKLKNVDSPFIDLDVMVEDLPLSDQEGDAAEAESQDELMVSEFVISIREMEIKINGSAVNTKNFENIFNALYKSGVTVRLVDDYAEYHTYKDVLEFLKEKGIKPVEEKK